MTGNPSIRITLTFLMLLTILLVSQLTG